MLFEGEEDLRPLPFAERRARLEAWHGKAMRRRAPTSRPCVDFGFDQRARGAVGRSARDRHRRIDAEAPRQPLSRRAPQGPLVQMEARAAHARRRADVCAAGQRQALVLLFRLYVRRLAGRRRAARPSSFRSASPISASPTRSCASSTRSCAITRWTVSGPCARSSPSSCSRWPSIRCIARRGTNPASPCAFPRIHRIRWDKPAEEADRLETLTAMIVE